MTDDELLEWYIRRHDVAEWLAKDLLEQGPSAAQWAIIREIRLCYERELEKKVHADYQRI